MALSANINRDTKTRSEPFEPIDFMNFVQRPPEKIYSLEELEEYASKIFRNGI